MARDLRRRVLIVLTGLGLAGVIGGCGGGSSEISLWRSGAAVTLEVQTASVADFGDAESISLTQTSVDGELRCEITASGARSLKGLFCELRFDPEQLTPIQAEPAGLLGPADETLTLAAMQRGRLMYGQARIHPELCDGFTGDGVLARVRFAKRSYDEKAAAGIMLSRSASAAPISELSASVAYWSGGDDVADWLLRWDYSSQGDYDQNSETGAPDLAPLAAHFGESVVPETFERAAIQSVIDGDSNGELGSADLVPIAQNFGNVVQGYNVYISSDAADYPATPAAVSTLEPQDSVLTTTASGSPLAERLAFAYHIEDLPGSYLWVRPYHGEQEGIPSNLVDLTELGPVLELETEPDGGTGSEDDPFIIDTATPYQFSVTDQVLGVVTEHEATEFTVSEDTAGQVDATGVLDVADTFIGTFNVSATFDGVAAKPVLFFSVPSSDTPVLILENQPLLGNGFKEDPFIADTATVYQFQLLHLVEGAVGNSADTEWAISETAAGSIVKGNPATLDIEDGYTGTFSVSATYKGATSLPTLIYLRVLAADTPQLSLAIPPVNGSGQEFDPYEVDNSQDYLLRLEVNSTDVGVDTMTEWTISDAAAGTVDISGAQALLQITDSYQEVFSISATYNGVSSVPAMLWLDGTPNGLPDPPVADLQVSPGTNVEDYLTEFTFDASGSTATVGSIDYYSWDWDGDGVWEISETNSDELTHIFGATGVYNTTVRVTDDRGATGVASVELTVTDGGNFHPVASLVAQVEAGSIWYEGLTAEVPVTVHFDASASSDPDGAIDHYLWDLDGDGVFSDLGASAQQSQSYAIDGYYYPAVQVFDDTGDMDTAYVDLTLTQPGGNMTPQASLQANPTFGAAPLEVSFDATLSSDPNGDPLSYEWDWDGNGTFDHDSGATATAVHTYNTAGNYTAVVQASDDGGLSDTATVTVTVDDGTASWHFYDVAVPDGTTYSSMGRYCSLAVVDGQPAIAFLADLEDSTYSPRQLMYARATDANGTAWGAPVTVHAPTNNWDEFGYQPELVIVDGVPTVAYSSRLYNGSWYYRVYARRASDALGSAWGSGQALAGSSSASASLHLDAEAVAGTLAVAYYFSGDNTLRYRRATNAGATAWGSEVVVDTFTFSGTPQTVDPSLAVINGNPALAYFFYTDGDISIPDELHYARATDDAGAAWAAPQTLATANGYGWFNNLLEVGGAPLLATVDNSEDEHSILKSLRGDDASGSAWGGAVTIHDSTGGGWFPPMVYSAKMAVVNGAPGLAFFVEDMSSTDLFFVRAANANGTCWQGTQVVLPDANMIAYELSLAEVNGHPAIAFAGAVDNGSETLTGLRYGVYY